MNIIITLSNIIIFCKTLVVVFVSTPSLPPVCGGVGAGQFSSALEGEEREGEEVKGESWGGRREERDGKERRGERKERGEGWERKERGERWGGGEKRVMGRKERGMGRKERGGERGEGGEKRGMGRKEREPRVPPLNPLHPWTHTETNMQACIHTTYSIGL